MTKGRDSGMPPPEQWESYFNAPGCLRALGCDRWSGDVVEFGCGYGTFTIPTAQAVLGNVYAIDIDPFMVAAANGRVEQLGLKNVVVEQRDFVMDGCGRKPESAGVALFFNILHIENPVGLLQEAHRALHSEGLVGIIHWIYDERTPRGPPLAVRPRPEQCRAWGEQAGLRWVRDVPLLPGSPWHWGMILERP